MAPAILSATTVRHICPRPLRAPPGPLVLPLTSKSLNLPSPPLATSLRWPDHPVFSPPPPPRRPPQGKKRSCVNRLELLTDDSAPSCRCRRFLQLAVVHDDLELARAVHAAVTKNPHKRGSEDEEAREEGDVEKGGGGEEETLLINSLISAYAKLGQLKDARNLFDELHRKDVVSYTCLISAYAKCGEEDEAMGLFTRMRDSGIDANAFSFVAILTSCIRQPNLELGLQIHALVVKSIHSCDSVHVNNALMGFYVECDRLEDAVDLFNEMAERDVTSWNTLISGMVKEGRYDEAFELFQEMRMDGSRGDRFTASSLLTAAVDGFPRATEGRRVHAHVLKMGLELDLSVANSLIAFYTKFGCTEDVVNVFHKMPRRDTISWNGMVRGFMVFGFIESAIGVFDLMPMRNGVSYNILLSGFYQNNDCFRALHLFKEMLEEGVELSDFTLTSAISACAMIGEVNKCDQIHAFAIKVGCRLGGWIEAALLNMHTKCNRMEDAQKMFQQWDDEESRAIAWTSLICGYARNGQPNEAICLFNDIQREKGFITMDKVMLTTILGVCGFLGFAEMGKQVHGYIIKSKDLFDLQVGNAIFSMYSKCGYTEYALKYFNRMKEHDLVSWNALITTHLLHQRGDDALSVWEQMKNMDVKPDSITFLLILLACKFTKRNSVDLSRDLILSMTSSYGITPTSEHYASIVDVLSFWGHFDEAEEVIRNMPFKPDAAIWRPLLNNCRLHSNLRLGREAVRHILASEPKDPSTYILISNLYAASGRWHCSEMVRKEMKEKGLHKHPAQSWIIHHNMVHSFFTRDRAHPQSKDIYSGLDILILECMKAGYVPDNSFVLHELEEYQKKDFLFYHSAKLAVTYGHLVTDVGKPVQIMKNIRLCGDCHAFLKCLSTVLGREISLRDATGFHYFRSGQCSCKDHW